MKLGELIKEYRNKNNITIREFAERSGGEQVLFISVGER